MTLIDLYRYSLSGILGGQCRYSPSCSHYSREAFRIFGFRKGISMTAKRLSRCHPWGGAGYDPVQETPTTEPHDQLRRTS